MDTEQIQDLLRKQQAGQLTDEEQAILDTWYLKLSQTETVHVDETDMTNRLEAVWAGLEVNKKYREAKVRSLWPRIVAAASVLIILSLGGFFLLHKTEPRQQIVQAQKPDLLPGSKTAVL